MSTSNDMIKPVNMRFGCNGQEQFRLRIKRKNLKDRVNSCSDSHNIKKLVMLVVQNNCGLGLQQIALAPSTQTCN